MPTFRNGSKSSFGQVSITPVTDRSGVATELTQPVSERTVTERSETVTTSTTVRTDVAGVATEVVQSAGQVGASSLMVELSPQTSATNLNGTNLGNISVQTVMNPLVVMRGGTPQPPDPVSIPSNEISLRLFPETVAQPTLPLQLFGRRNGITVKTTSNIRPDLLSMTDFKSIYQTQNLNLSNFGTYLDDLYKASVLQDGVRRYTLANQNPTNLEPLLSALNNNIRSTLSRTQSTIANLDVLIATLNRVKAVLDIKKLLGSANQTQPTSPLLKLPDFFTGRMLFSAEAYNSFSDTKIAYQLISDLTNIMSLCSFNLLDNFRDLDRLQSPQGARAGNVVDPITIDTVYGTGLRYTPSSISNVYITDYATYNNIANVLPPETDNKIKFLINLLSKEFRISYGLGNTAVSNQLNAERTLFGFGTSGNPFLNVNGTVPPDIFISPNGGLASLFYQQIENNAVVLPFESRQVAGDGETVFIPGTVFFGDGILNKNFASYETYRDNFSRFYTLARNVYNGLFLDRTVSTFATLKQTALLESVTRLFKSCQDQFRANGTNADSTSVLVYITFLLCQGNTRLKFEFYNLLLLLILYSEREENSGVQTNLNNFRRNLFNELSTRLVNGRAINETNLESLVLSQITLVSNLFQTSVLTTPNINGAVDPTVGNFLRSQLTVPLGQFSRLPDSLKDSRCGPNLLKSVYRFAQDLFNVCSVNNQSIHLSQGSTATRYNSLTMSGMLLLSFELFSSFTQKFSTDVVLDIVGSSVTVDFKLDTQSVAEFLGGDPEVFPSNVLNNYQTKLREEDEIVTNILEFFKIINNAFSQIPTEEVRDLNLSQLAEVGVEKINLGSIRTAKNALKYFADKGRAINWTASENMEFYNPSGKYVSNSNWYATKIALKDPKFATIGKQKIATIGIPNGFLDAALSARLSKNNITGNSLNTEVSDLINVKVYKLGKNDGLIYNPISFKFDMSLFPYGFDGAFEIIYGTRIVPQSTDTYQNLLSRFKFYDFDELNDYRSVVAKTLNQLRDSDPFYELRADFALEVVNNLYTSFILDNYLNVLTGLSFCEETFLDYQATEINDFTNSISEYVRNKTGLRNVKNMTSPHQNFLNFFTNETEQKLMLTLCNDISKTVLKPKMYDRVFHVAFDPNGFSINVSATKQTLGGEELLTNLETTDRVERLNGLLYRKPESFDVSQYFISVEIIN